MSAKFSDESLDFTRVSSNQKNIMDLHDVFYCQGKALFSIVKYPKSDTELWKRKNHLLCRWTK